MLEKAELFKFICRFLRRIYCDSTTHVEFAGKTGGQFLMASGVRRGCPASGFWFAQDAIIPRNAADLDFLQPVPCAHADDFAVAALSFRLLMTTLSPAFQVVDQTARLNLNHRKCFLVQYGSESCQPLLDWVATNCEEFRLTRWLALSSRAGERISQSFPDPFGGMAGEAWS